MNRKIYTGQINERDRAGRVLRWTGRQYDYVARCGRTAKTKALYDSHTFDCAECEEKLYTNDEQDDYDV